jgi:hypothetical protein
MTWTRRTASLFRRLFRKEKVEAELDSELHSYLATLVDRYVAKGYSLHAAQRAAQMEFEGAEQVKDRVREVRSGCKTSTVSITATTISSAAKRYFISAPLLTTPDNLDGKGFQPVPAARPV